MRFIHYTHTKDCRPNANAVWLQYVGWVEGCQAIDAKPGMYMLYNGGSSAEIIKVEPRGKKSVIITTREDGKEYTRVRSGIIPAQFPA